MVPRPALLDRIERYYDAVPRARARTEEIGPFTLFVAHGGWPWYARPRLGEAARANAHDVLRTLARQRDLGVPQAMEWVDETTPGLDEVAEAAGMHVEHCPLLVLEGEPTGDAGSARMLDADEVDLVRRAQAAVSVGFGNEGTETGAPGIPERDTAAAAVAPTILEVVRDGMVAGRYRFAAVIAPGAPEVGPVGGGSYTPVDGVAEIAGVAVLPAYRRRGLGAQLTYVLARDALDRGVTTVFCGAASLDVARVYERVGFRRIGTACIASVKAPA